MSSPQPIECTICYSTICGCSHKARMRARAKQKKNRYVCGDGTSHATEMTATKHAQKVWERTGKIISVERK